MTMKAKIKKRLTVFSLIFFLFTFLQAQNTLLSYRLTIDQPEKHLAKIQIEVPVFNQDTLTLAMPAWSPGRYVIYNFAKNVFDVQVKTENDQTIRPILIDKQTWKIPTQKAKQINISYQLFANTLDGTFSKIDSVGASINGASVFAYIAEMKNQPLQLTIHVPESWQTVCALNPQNNGLFNARSYDELIDSPIELGPTLHKHHFQVLGKDHHLIFHQPVDGKLLYHFQQDLEKIITYFASLFGDSLPYHNYTFFFHLNKNLQHTDGMEHTANCRVLLRMDLNQIMPDANADADYDNLIWLSAHEFFHTWNVKRLRPVGLGPFDYSKEVYTPSLWIAEGWTSYYAYLALLRTGIYTEEKFLSEIAGRITRYENSPGKQYRTLAETSILTWLFKGGVPHYAETNIDQTTYSYYYKGLIAAFLLDVLLRAEGQPPSSLDALLKEMWRRFYRQNQGNYFLPGRGYTEQEIEHMINSKLPKNRVKFLQNVVHSTKALPYEIVERLGLKLKKDVNRFRLVKQENHPPKAQKLWQQFKLNEIEN